MYLFVASRVNLSPFSLLRTQKTSLCLGQINQQRHLIKSKQLVHELIIIGTMRLTTALASTLLVVGHIKRGRAAVSPATSNCVDQDFTDKILYEPDGGKC